MSTTQKPIASMLATLAAAPQTSGRPFLEVMTDAAAAVIASSKAKSRVKIEEMLAGVATQWGQQLCNAVTVDQVGVWQKSLGPVTRVWGLQVLAVAAAQQRIIQEGLGTQVRGADFYANPVWTISGASGVGLGVAGLGMAAGNAVMRATGTKGGEGTVADQLKNTLAKNQRIWITDTHLVFIHSTGTRFSGEPIVRAAVPLGELARVKKAPRFQLLVRFSLQFTDGSKAAFMSFARYVDGLQAVLGPLQG